MTARRTMAINLGVHLLVLALLFAGWAGLAAMTGATAPGLENLGVVLLLLPLGVYVIVTSVVVLGLARRRHAALILHAVGLAIVAVIAIVGLTVEGDDARTRAPEARATPSVAECVRLGPIVVHPGARLRAQVTVTNDCVVAVTIADVDLNGFPPGGGNTILWGASTRTELAPGRSIVFELSEGIDGDPTRDLAGWHWRSNVLRDAPDGGMSCFATSGAPATSGCTMLDAGSVQRRAP